MIYFFSDFFGCRSHSTYNVIMVHLLYLCLPTLTWLDLCCYSSVSWFKKTLKTKLQNVNGSCLNTGKVTFWPECQYYCHALSSLVGHAFRLQVIVENIKGVRAAKGIFKATYPALRNIQTHKLHMRTYKVHVCTHARIHETSQRLKTTKSLVYISFVLFKAFLSDKGDFVFIALHTRRQTSLTDRAEKQ